jgi:hypothetical protein
VSAFGRKEVGAPRCQRKPFTTTCSCCDHALWRHSCLQSGQGLALPLQLRGRSGAAAAGGNARLPRRRPSPVASTHAHAATAGARRVRRTSACCTQLLDMLSVPAGLLLMA